MIYIHVVCLSTFNCSTYNTPPPHTHTYTHTHTHTHTHPHTHAHTHTHWQLLDPAARLGCDQMGGYPPLKDHLFFEDIDWETIHEQTPPKLMPYLPSNTKGESALRSDILVSVMWSVCDCHVTVTWFRSATVAARKAVSCQTGSCFRAALNRPIRLLPGLKVKRGRSNSNNKPKIHRGQYTYSLHDILCIDELCCLQESVCKRRAYSDDRTHRQEKGIVCFTAHQLAWWLYNVCVCGSSGNACVCVKGSPMFLQTSVWWCTVHCTLRDCYPRRVGGHGYSSLSVCLSVCLFVCL